MDDWAEDLLRKYTYFKNGEYIVEQEYAEERPEMTMSTSAVDYIDWDEMFKHTDDWFRYFKATYNFERFHKPESIDIDEFI